MRLIVWLIALVVAGLPIFGASVRGDEAADKQLAEKMAEWGASYEQDVLPIIRAKCIECHSGDSPDGEFDLAKFADGKSAAEAGDAWDRVARRVRQNEMPPQGSPGLNDPEKSKFHRWVDARPNQDLCRQLASDETQSWYRGYVMSRRLTAVEYTNAITQLLGVPLLESEIPPSDAGGGEGFDTVGDTLFTSPIHLEAYLTTADRVVDAALANWKVLGGAASESPASAASASDSSGAVRPSWLALARSAEPAAELDDDQAATRMLSAFARLAWRRPIESEELERLLTLFRQARAAGLGYLDAVAQPMKAIVVSPHFLFVVESEPEAGGVQRLTPQQLALRLSLLIWSSIPDEALLDAADRGDLHDDQKLLVEVRRMLADPKARGLGENFGLQWLGLRNFGQLRPDPEVFPEYNAELASDMREEAVALVTAVFREDRPLTDLIAADYAYVNGRLAAHYGLPLPADAPWQKLPLEDQRRGGVVTMASVLTSASYPRRTSPVLRGRWLLEELLGSRVPPPPPNVPPLEEPGGALTTALTMRQRLEVHRQNPECASCHDRMDPLGFGLENFDAIGRWRTQDQGAQIDSTGTLPSGERFDGPQGLKAILVQRSDEFAQHFVRKLLGFALGRELNKFDRCVADECLKALQENDYRASVLIERIALSYPFQHRYYKK